MAEFHPSPRQEEALDITRSVGVTASAGTGKTFILQKRFVKLLEAGIEPRSILCLTYTDKAAAEMREKIEKELRSQVEETKSVKLQKCLDDIHQCTISTFHGFCSGILREFSLEAGVPMGYAIMDTLDQITLISNTIADLIQHPPGELERQVIFLAQHIRRKTDIIEAIRRLYDKWDVCSAWFKMLKTDEHAVWEKWDAEKKQLIDALMRQILEDEQIERFFADMEAIIAENKFRSNMIIPQACAGYTSAKNAAAYADKLQILNVLGKLEPEKYEKYAGYDIESAQRFERVRSLLKDISQKLDLFSFDDPRTRLMIEFMRAYGEVTERVVSLVGTKKAEGGYLNFDDLIIKVRRLLETNTDVLEELKARYKSIMVDEVQDNDPSLTAIVWLLAGDFSRNRKLFVVGDMKQSIYGFRGADPEEAADLLNSFSRPPVELDTNFRTVAPLIDVINRIFTFQYAEGREKNIVYAGVGANRQTETGSFTILQEPPKAEAADGQVPDHPDEAELLASWIRRHIDEKEMEVYDRTEIDDGSGGKRELGWRPATYRDFAVLIRKKTPWAAELGAAFKKYGIPFHFHSGSSIYHEQEIYDFMNVITASVYHENNIALYGALISPFFGIPETALMDALSAVPPERFIETYQRKNPTLWRRLSDAQDAGIRDALAKLDEFRTASRTLPVPAFIRKIVRETGVLSVYGASPDGFDKIRNIRKFIEAAEAQCGEKGVTIAAFIRLIETCIAEKVDDELGATDAESEQDDRVKILTMHVSKGLEYNVVILYRSGKKIAGTHSDTVYCDEDYHCGYASLKHPSDDKMNLFWFLGTLIRLKRESLEISEEKRLFYVGMTRARDHLAVTSAVEPDHDSSMYWLCEAADPAEIADDIVSSAYGNVPELIAGETAIPAGWTPHLAVDRAEEDAGMRYALRRGTGVHELFEGRDFAETCRTYRFSREEAEKFRASLDFFRRDPRLQDIDEEWHELGFLNRDGEKRIIDMLVRYRDGSFAVFDFKTGDPADLTPELREKYRRQLEEYTDIVRSVYKPAGDIPAWFYFADKQVFIDARRIADSA